MIDRPLGIAVIGLFVLAILVVVYVASDLLIPIFLAGFLSILLYPIVNAGQRIGISPVITAGSSLALVLFGIAIITTTLSAPAEKWLEQAPDSIRELKQISDSTQSSLENIKELADEVEGFTAVEENSANENTQAVVVQEPGFFQSAVVSLPGLMAKAVIVVFLSFFLMISGDNWLLKLTRCGKTWGQRRRMLVIARSIRKEISRYLGTVTLINLGLGVATATYLYFLGVDNFIMWGCFVALFNFAPYAGAFVSTLLLTIVGFGSFDSTTEALLVPAGFLLLTTLEGQVITPAVLGSKMSLSPAIVMLSVVLGGWMWGIAGALMAVPLMISFKAFCDHYPPLKFLGYFLSNDRRRRRDAEAILS